MATYKTTSDLMFMRGYLLATAHVARRGEDTIVQEMLHEVGVHSVKDLAVAKLDKFDRTPLTRVIRISK